MPHVRVTCFRSLPSFAQGLARDLRVRWALEEAGIPYEERPLSFEELKGDAYRALQPFGQVPILQVDDVAYFESGAIVLDIAEKSGALMPSDGADRARVRMWMFAALNTLEPQSGMLNFIELRQPNPSDDVKRLRDEVAERVSSRLDAVVGVLGDRPHLVDGRFSAADLLMTTVLRALRTTDLVAKRPVLDAYVRRHEARPAFQKALRAHMAHFEASAPKS